MSASQFRLVALFSLLVALSGCSSDAPDNCPGASSIVMTSVGTVFKNAMSTDASNILYTAEITGVTASCDADKDAQSSTSSVNVSFRATRPPNGGAAQYKVPYFVAISQADRLVTKKEYEIEFSFDPGQTETTFSDTINSVAVTADQDKHTYDYEILVGLQLTKAQLDYNRSTGRLVP